MAEENSSPHRPPLYDEHVALGAKFAAFGGWLMPLEYAGQGVLAEHEAVRQRVGVFDVSHLGKLHLAGPGAADYLNTRLTGDLGRIGPSRAQYTLLCDSSGGVTDDLIVYLKAADDVLLIPNAANTATVAARLRDGLPGGLSLADQHTDFVVLAIQGPSSQLVVEALGLPAAMDYMAFQTASYGGFPLTVCRTGYTGERGYELVAPNAAAPGLWQAILTAGQPFGIMACGLGARDTLRTEMGYPLHGQDISPGISPVAAGLGWAIGWSKPVFDGVAALGAVKAAGPAQRLRGLKAQGRGIPRPGMAVVGLDDAGRNIGRVTSGTFSPSLKTGIGLALIDAAIEPGAVVGVAIRGKTEPFDVVKPPFVASHVQ